jgi:hypothetical protein
MVCLLVRNTPTDDTGRRAQIAPREGRGRRRREGLPWTYPRKEERKHAHRRSVHGLGTYAASRPGDRVRRLFLSAETGKIVGRVSVPGKRMRRDFKTPTRGIAVTYCQASTYIINTERETLGLARRDIEWTSDRPGQTGPGRGKIGPFQGVCRRAMGDAAVGHVLAEGTPEVTRRRRLRADHLATASPPVRRFDAKARPDWPGTSGSRRSTSAGRSAW